MPNLIPACGACGDDIRDHANDGQCRKTGNVFERNEDGSIKANEAGKPVTQTIQCGCKRPVRTDVMLCMQQTQLLQQIARLNQVVWTLLLVTCEAHSLEVNEKGEVQKKNGGLALV